VVTDSVTTGIGSWPWKPVMLALSIVPLFFTSYAVSPEALLFTVGSARRRHTQQSGLTLHVVCFAWDQAVFRIISLVVAYVTADAPGSLLSSSHAGQARPSC
jgi:hypothetical protein